MEANIEKSFEHINETAMQIEDNSPDDEVNLDLSINMGCADYRTDD